MTGFPAFMGRDRFNNGTLCTADIALQQLLQTQKHYQLWQRRVGNALFS